jgi:hypothetical protein
MMNTVIVWAAPCVFAIGAAVAGGTFVIKSGTGQVVDSVRFAKTAFFAVTTFTCGVIGGGIIGMLLGGYFIRTVCDCNKSWNSCYGSLK